MNEFSYHSEPTNWSGYTFTYKYRDGKPTRWYQILMLLKEKGPMTKKQILDEIWPDRHELNYGGVVDRGYCSSLFLQMHRENMIEYIPSTRMWYLTGMSSCWF